MLAMTLCAASLGPSGKADGPRLAAGETCYQLSVSSDGEPVPFSWTYQRFEREAVDGREGLRGSCTRRSRMGPSASATILCWTAARCCRSPSPTGGAESGTSICSTARTRSQARSTARTIPAAGSQADRRDHSGRDTIIQHTPKNVADERK